MISPELLRRYPYFADVSEDALKEVPMIGEENSATADTTLFTDGDRADSLHILVEGEVDLKYTLDNGDQRTVDTLVALVRLGRSLLGYGYGDLQNKRQVA